jgi:hypothetical protein
MKILTRQWKSTQRDEVLELLVKLLDKPFLPKSICNVLFKDRKDIKMAIALARGTQEGLSPLAIQRIHQNGIPECCVKLNPNDSTIREKDRWMIWTIVAAGHAPLPRLLEGVSCFLDNRSTESQLAIANILRHYPATDCLKFLEAMAPQAMLQAYADRGIPSSDTQDDGSQFRRDIRKLLSALTHGEANLKNAIESFFCEFNIETLLQHLDLLMDDAITCFAEVMRSLHPKWPQMLIPALESPSGERRCKAAIAASYLGPHPDLKASLNKLLQDEFVMVQEEAAFALKDYPAPSLSLNLNSTQSIDVTMEASH